MGVAFVMQSIAGRSKRDARVTGSFTLDSRLLVAFADAAKARLDQPEDASLDWCEGQDYDDPISPRECYDPEEVTAGLSWLGALAKVGDKTSRDVWMEYMQGPFSPAAFVARLSRDLDGLIAFCGEAGARGDKLIGVWVP